jgi:hypothetical protein
LDRGIDFMNVAATPQDTDPQVNEPVPAIVGLNPPLVAGTEVLTRFKLPALIVPNPALILLLFVVMVPVVEIPPLATNVFATVVEDPYVDWNNVVCPAFK